MSLPEPFLHSWQQMIEYNNEYFTTQDERIFYTRATVSYHSFARNSLVDQTRGDWILMLDTDVTFEPDILVRMLNKMNKFDIDVLVAPYLYKSSPHPPVLYGYDPDKKEKFIIEDWQKDESVDLIPFRSAGGGCLLIRRKELEKIKKNFS